MLDGLHHARLAAAAADAAAWDVQQALLNFLEGSWDQPVNSLWEVRGPRRSFVHSKVMAWAGVNRGVQAVERFGLDGPVDRWKALQDEIHTDVCRKVSTPTATPSPRSTAPPVSRRPADPPGGFPALDDQRVIGTVAAVRRELDHHGLLLRYHSDQDGGVDGLGGDEGAFLACSFWLADALHGIGRTGEARALFERLLRLRNDVGLLSEEYDPIAGRHLGDTPQAFSHVGLINTARQLSTTAPATATRTPRRSRRIIDDNRDSSTSKPAAAS